MSLDNVGNVCNLRVMSMLMSWDSVSNVCNLRVMAISDVMR